MTYTLTVEDLATLLDLDREWPKSAWRLEVDARLAQWAKTRRPDRRLAFADAAEPLLRGLLATYYPRGLTPAVEAEIRAVLAVLEGETT